jgi:hypothetical protein
MKKILPLYLFFSVPIIYGMIHEGNEYKKLPILDDIKNKRTYPAPEKEIKKSHYHISSINIVNGELEQRILFNGNVKIPFPNMENTFFLESTWETLTISYISLPTEKTDKSSLIINTFNLKNLFPSSPLRNNRFRLERQSAHSKKFYLYYESEYSGKGLAFLAKNIDLNDSPSFSGMQFTPLVSRTEKTEVIKETPSSSNKIQPPTQASESFFTPYKMSGALLLFAFCIGIYAYNYGYLL